MNGIDPRHFPMGLSGADIRAKHGLAGKTIIGFTGFLRDWHGLPSVLDVMHGLVASHGIHFLVVGDGPGREALIQRAYELGLSAHLSVTGVVERAEIPAYVASFDIALQPKATEYASPLKLFEYMALGCAILAPRQPNLQEVLTHDDNAALFEPDDTESFRANLHRLIVDSALRDRLGRAAANAVVTQDLTWDGNARRAIAAVQALEPSAAEKQKPPISRSGAFIG